LVSALSEEIHKPPKIDVRVGGGGKRETQEKEWIGFSESKAGAGKL